MTSAGARSAVRSTRMRTRARTRPILAMDRRACKVTKVLVRSWRMIALAWPLLSATAGAQAAALGPECPPTTTGLYARIRSVELDPQRVYHIRDASIDRPNLHL